MRAHHHQQPSRRGGRAQARRAVRQRLAIAAQQLLGPAQTRAATGRQYHGRMRAAQRDASPLRQACSCAAMLNAIACGPDPPSFRPTGERSRGANESREARARSCA